MRKRQSNFRFSLQEQMVGVAALSGALAGYMYFGWAAVGVPLYAMSIWLVRKGNRDYRPATSYVGYGLAAVSTITVFAGMGLWMLFGRGPIFFQQNYPPVMARVIEVANADAKGAKVACKSGVGAEIFVGRFYLTQTQVDDIAEVIGSDYSIGTLDYADFYKSFPLWWGPSRDPGQQTLRGEYDGGQFFGTYNPQTSYLHVLWRRERAERSRY